MSNVYVFTALVDADLCVDTINDSMAFDDTTITWDEPRIGTYQDVEVWTVAIPVDWMTANPGVLDDSAWTQVDEALIIRPTPPDPLEEP